MSERAFVRDPLWQEKWDAQYGIEHIEHNGMTYVGIRKGPESWKVMSGIMDRAIARQEAQRREREALEALAKEGQH